jgi:hypothetical protein
MYMDTMTRHDIDPASQLFSSLKNPSIFPCMEVIAAQYVLAEAQVYNVRCARIRP